MSVYLSEARSEKTTWQVNVMQTSVRVMQIGCTKLQKLCFVISCHVHILSELES